MNELAKKLALWATLLSVGGGFIGGMEYIGWPPYASASDLENTDSQLAGTSLAVLYLELDNLLRWVNQHIRKGDVVPFDLKRRVQDVCVRIEQSGGATPSACKIG